MDFEIDWNIGGVAIALWLLMIICMIALPKAFGSSSYFSVFGVPTMVGLFIILLPISYFVTGMIANR